jgi:hypothetical protein
MDATLSGQEEAQRLLIGAIEAELTGRGVGVIAYKP